MCPFNSAASASAARAISSPSPNLMSGVHSTAPRRPPRRSGVSGDIIPVQVCPFNSAASASAAREADAWHGVGGSLSIQQRRVGLRGISLAPVPHVRPCPFKRAASASAANARETAGPHHRLCPFNSAASASAAQLSDQKPGLRDGVHSTAPRRPPRHPKTARGEWTRIKCPFNSAASASAAPIAGDAAGDAARVSIQQRRVGLRGRKTSRAGLVRTTVSIQQRRVGLRGRWKWSIAGRC